MRSVASTTLLKRFHPSLQGKYDEAEPLYTRAIVAGEKTLGPGHPEIAVWMNDKAIVLECQVRFVLFPGKSPAITIVLLQGVCCSAPSVLRVYLVSELLLQIT